MSDKTLNLKLPLIYQNQSQKELLLNESLTILDNLFAKGAISKTLATPPLSPQDGDIYIIPPSSTGAWVDEENNIAYFNTNWGWRFHTPKTGYIIYVNNEEKLYIFNGTNWVISEDFNNLEMLGINTDADSANKLAVKSEAILFDNIADDVQVKLNKNSASDFASFLFQNNYSGRAEIGLTGDDDFSFKVSPNGSDWYNAININRNNGNINLLNPLAISEGGTAADNIIQACKNLKTCYILAQSGEAVSVGAVTTEQVLTTINLPANAMGANGRLEIDCSWSISNNANIKTPRVRFGGTSGVAFYQANITTSLSSRVITAICNRNNISSQISGAGPAISVGNSITSLVSSSVNTGANVDIVISGQKANASDDLILESYSIKLYPRD